MASVWEAAWGVSDALLQGSQTTPKTPDLSGITLDQVLSWCVIGLLAGMVLNAVSTKKPGGLGKLRNLAIGVGAAFVGGWVSTVLGLDLGLGQMTIRYDDVVAAVVVSVLVLFGATWAKRRWDRRHLHD